MLDSAEVRAHVEDVRRIHDACFPEDVADEDAEGEGGHLDDAFWDRLTACHDADDVLWFLLVDAGDARAEVSAADARRNANDRDARPGTAEGGVENGIENQTARVLGFAAATRYARCAYGMHLAVDPRHRGSGHGAWLMREVQSWARSVGYAQMQASVDASAARLIAYYESLGAERVAGLGGAAPGSAPTTVRIARRFDDALCERELREARARHRTPEPKRARFKPRRGEKQRRRTKKSLAALGALVGALAAAAKRFFFSTSKTSRFFGRAGGRAGRARGAATVTVVGDLRRARTRERGERETS